MRISLRQGFAAAPQVLENTWAEVVSLYGAAVSAHGTWTSKEQVPLIAFGAFNVPDEKGLGFRETCLNPEGLWCLGLDYDDTPWEAALDVIGRAQMLSPEGGLWHTTWRHGTTGNDVARFRIVLPLGRNGVGSAVSPELWPHAWNMFSNQLYAEGLDAACKNVGRCWYLPSSSIPSQAPSWGVW